MELTHGKPISLKLSKVLIPVLSTVHALNNICEEFDTNKQAVRNILYRNLNVSDKNKELIIYMMRLAFELNATKKKDIESSQRIIKRVLKTA